MQQLKAKAKQPVYVNGKIVGQIEGDIFVKHVRSTKHFLRQPPAICFDQSSLEYCRRLGVNFVNVHDLDTGTMYFAPLSLIEKKGFPLNRGHGNQVGLPLHFWKKQGEAVQERLF